MTHTLPHDYNADGDDSWLFEGDPRRYLTGGRRCAVQASGWLENWWIGTSPRNGDNASVEGAWEDWVELARAILKANGEARFLGYIPGEPEKP